MPWVLLFAFAQLAASAAAPALYKCVSGSGAASYQSHACADGQQTAWVREIPPSAAPSAAPVSSPAPEARTASASGTSRRRAQASPAKPRKADTRCAAARQSAAVQRDRLWNRLTFKQRSELDARVAIACAR